MATRRRCTLRKCIDHQLREMNWNPLVHFRAGSCLCLRASYLVQPLSSSLHQPGLTGCWAETLEGLHSNNRWELPHAAASMLCWLLTHWIGSQPNFLKWKYHFYFFNLFFRYLRIWTKWFDFSKYWWKRRRWAVYIVLLLNCFF